MPTIAPVRPAHDEDTAPPVQGLTVLDLFAGAGGLSAGLREVGGFRTVAAVEKDVAAAATFTHNHPETDVFVGSIEKWLAHSDVPSVDVIVGGPPCQGFSTLGKQDAEDERNTLWREYAQTIVAARPRYFVVENVAAFARSRQFAQFLAATGSGGRLADYTFEHAILNAADFGAPQARRRAVLVGHHRDLPFPGWPEVTHDRHTHRTVRTVLGAGPGEPLGTMLPEGSVSFGGRELPGTFTTDQLHVGRRYETRSLLRFGHIPEGGNRFDIPDHLLAPCWRRHTSGAADVMGRLHWDRPAVTIRTEFFKPEKGRYLHPSEHRAITHYEAAVLQGFPLDYKWVGSKVAIARQIGNAVPIPLAAAIGRTLRRAAGASGREPQNFLPRRPCA